MVIGPLTSYQLEWLLESGLRAHTGTAVDTKVNPPRYRYCVGRTEREVREWVETEAWRLYDKREGIIR